MTQGRPNRTAMRREVRRAVRREVRRAVSRAVIRAVSGAAVCALLAPALAAQQGEFPAECRSDAAAPDAIWTRWIPRLGTGAVVEYGDSLFALLQAGHDRLTAPQHAAMRAALEALRAELRASEQKDWSEAPSAARFVITRRGVAAVLFEGEDEELRLTDTDAVEARATLCTTALLARALATYAGEHARELAVRAALRRLDRWDRFTARGYSMLPLELLVNSWGPFRDRGSSLEPPRTQMVLLHPSPAFGWAGAPWEKVAGSEGIAFEWGGLLRYTASRNDYYGASFFTMYGHGDLPTNGVMVHLSALGRLGVTRTRDPATGERLIGGVISADLWKLLRQGSDRLDALRDAAEERLESARATCRSAGLGNACETGGGRTP